ncbi:septum site-determining protein MinC [Alcaligenaceae bacterium SAGV3]|nr:septum site-determining protein MinC [Alcaligenaceae bacterium SAGV3]
MLAARRAAPFPGHGGRMDPDTRNRRETTATFSRSRPTLPAPTSRHEATPAATETVAEQPPAAPHAVPTMIIDKPLRSGQRIYARHADLIVMGVVSHGAEVIADGNIHVYGPLRGKAMAGARGDTKARIYTTRLEAELVAVAGVYRTLATALSPDIQDKPALIRLEGEKLLVEPLPI